MNTSPVALPADPQGTLPVCVAALYHFTPFTDCAALRAHLLDTCHKLGIRGILLLAHEGINGTIAGSDSAITTIVTTLRALPGCADMEIKFSRAPSLPFRRMKVRIKREIVTMGIDGLDPRRDVAITSRPLSGTP